MNHPIYDLLNAEKSNFTACNGRLWGGHYGVISGTEKFRNIYNKVIIVLFCR